MTVLRRPVRQSTGQGPTSAIFRLVSMARLETPSGVGATSSSRPLSPVRRSGRDVGVEDPEDQRIHECLP